MIKAKYWWNWPLTSPYLQCWYCEKWWTFEGYVGLWWSCKCCFLCCSYSNWKITLFNNPFLVTTVCGSLFFFFWLLNFFSFFRLPFSIHVIYPLPKVLINVYLKLENKQINVHLVLINTCKVQQIGVTALILFCT